MPDLTHELVVRLLRTHLEARGFFDIEVVEIAGAPYAKASPKSAVARAAIESATEVYGTPPVVYPLDPASGPVGAVCGVRQPPTPVASFGVGYAGSNPHGPDEHVRIEDFLLGVKQFGRVVHRLAQIAQEDAREHKTQELIAPNAG